MSDLDPLVGPRPDRWAPRRPIAGIAKAVLTSSQIPVTALTDRSGPLHTGLRILCYHRITDEHDQLALSPRRFRRQLEMVAASGLPVVDLWSFDFSRSDSSNRLAITFDDGYEDFARNALPELERFGFPAIVFVVPEAVDRRTTFPWYRGAPHPGLLGWDEMQAIEHAAQVRFEPHSMTHPCLPDLPSDRMRWELFASKQAVEDRFERAARIFCYPGGFYGRREVEAVRDVGYAAAVTCEYGLNTHPFPVFELSRTLIDRYDTGWVFRSRLRALVDRPPLGRRSRILA